MGNNRLHRRLDILEKEMVLGRPQAFNIAFHGTIDVFAMNHAWNAICVRHPVLQGKIIEDSDGYALDSRPGDIPILFVCDGDENRLREEVFKPWNMEEALARLVLIRSREGGFLSLLFDHAIADATAIFSLLKKLWSLYSDILGGRDVSMKEICSLPRPPTELLRDRWGKVDIEEIQTPDATSFERVPPAEDQIEPIHRRLHLKREETTRLRKASRAHRISIHSLLCGAILVALRGQGVGQGSALMACWSMVDLRGRVDPPISPTETTNCLAFQLSEVLVGSDPLEVSSMVNRQIESDIARKRVSFLMSSLRASRVQTELEQHTANTSINNLRIVETFTQPSSLEITDFFITPPRYSTTPFPTHGASTYDGHLSIFSSYPSTLFSSEDVKTIEDRTFNILTSL